MNYGVCFTCQGLYLLLNHMVQSQLLIARVIHASLQNLEFGS